MILPPTRDHWRFGEGTLTASLRNEQSTAVIIVIIYCANHFHKRNYSIQKCCNFPTFHSTIEKSNLFLPRFLNLWSPLTLYHPLL